MKPIGNPLNTSLKHNQAMLRYEELIECYYPRLHAYASRMIGSYPSVRRWEQTDDVVQLSMLRLLRAIESSPPKSELHFFHLASLQVRRLLIDLSRTFSGPNGVQTNHRTHHGRVDLYEDLAIEEGAKADLTLQQWEAFHRCVDDLPPVYREIFDLFSNGRSF